MDVKLEYSFFSSFFASGVGFPLYPEIYYFITIILQRIRIIVGEAGFESGTSYVLSTTWV